MPQHTIQTFFKDGTYVATGRGDPSCTFPNGSNFNGTLEVSSTYQCEDINQKFLQKNFKRQTAVAMSLFSFNICHDYLCMNDGKQSITGKFNIKGNRLYVKFFGYNQTLGKMCKQRGSYTLTPTGFFQRWYYLNNHGKYVLYLNVNYSMLL